jgi:phosphoglycerate dehydrogenase-like enzyme
MDPQFVRELFPADVVDRLQQVVDLNPELVLTRFDTDRARVALIDAEVLITGWGCPLIDGTVLSAAPRLRAAIHSAGTIKEHIDPLIFDKGVVVSSAAAANAVPVAEYTTAAVIFAAKRAFARARWFADDRENQRWRPGAGTGLYGATVGVVGASKIGRLVLDRLAALDVKLLLADPYVTTDEARALHAELVDPDELCRRSDVVSIHAPELPETYHLIDDRRLRLLRDGAAVINTARGSLVDTDALARHCASGRISAVLDVTDPEPLPATHPLLHMPNVLVTPHIAGAQGRELRRLGEFAAEEVRRLVYGEPLRGQVHADQLARMA